MVTHMHKTVNPHTQTDRYNATHIHSPMHRYTYSSQSKDTQTHPDAQIHRYNATQIHSPMHRYTYPSQSKDKQTLADAQTHRFEKNPTLLNYHILHLHSEPNLLIQFMLNDNWDESEFLTFCTKDHQICNYLLYYDPNETKCSKNLHLNAAYH